LGPVTSAAIVRQFNETVLPNGSQFEYSLPSLKVGDYTVDLHTTVLVRKLPNPV